jgi:hypothetical protein
VEPDSDVKVVATLGPIRCQRIEHVERHAGRPCGIAARRRIGPAGNHVRVADRLDLLEAVGIDQAVEDGEDLVEHGDDRRRLGC